MTAFSQNTVCQSIIKTLPKPSINTGGQAPANYTLENTHKKLTLLSPFQIFYLIAFYLLSAVLIFSGIAKIIDPLPLLNTLKLVTFLHEELQMLIATLIPVLEIGLAVLMLMKTKLKITLPSVAFLFASLLAFSICRTILIVIEPIAVPNSLLMTIK